MRAPWAGWRSHLLVTVASNGQAVSGTKDALLKKVADFAGEKMERLLGDGSWTAAQLKTARDAFVASLASIGIKTQVKNGDKQCICTLCGRIARANATDWVVHIAQNCVADHPHRDDAAAHCSNLKTTGELLGAAKRKAVEERAEEVHEERIAAKRIPAPYQPSSGAGGSGSGCNSVPLSAASLPGGIRAKMDRQLTEDEVKKIDEMLCRFCYAEGLPFRVLTSSILRKGLGMINQSYIDKSRLSSWNIRHSFLDNESDSIEARVLEAITAAFALTLASDGWSGLQKDHEMNVMICTPKALFVDNIFTKADRVDGEYQVRALRPPLAPLVRWLTA